MTQDAYWDELGVAWTALSPASQTIAPRIKQRLRRQTVLIAAVLFAGIPLSLAGAALGVWTIWRGASVDAWFFVTRGIALVAISLLAGLAAWSFRGTLKDNTGSVAAMIAQALQRTERWSRAIQLGYFSLVIATVFGMIGYAIRLQMGKPPVLSPVEPLVLLAVLGFTLFLLQRRAREEIAKYRHLKTLLLEEGR